MKLDLIRYSDITNFEFLTSRPDSNNKNIIQLAWGGDDFDYGEILVSVLKDSNVDDLFPDSDNWLLEKRKCRFAILSYLQGMYQADFVELLNKVAEVMLIWDYPEDMDSFINYLPPKDGYNPTLYSHKENTVRLVNLFNKFLNKEQQYF